MKRAINYNGTFVQMLIIICYCCDVAAIDDGEALRKLILAEKSLLANNFPQGLMTIACVAIGTNYDLVVKNFGGCALPVLFGAPQSAKTTALKAALSVVGNPDIVQGTCRSSMLFFYSTLVLACFINEMANERLLMSHDRPIHMDAYSNR